MRVTTQKEWITSIALATGSNEVNPKDVNSYPHVLTEPSLNLHSQLALDLIKMLDGHVIY